MRWPLGAFPTLEEPLPDSLQKEQGPSLSICHPPLRGTSNWPNNLSLNPPLTSDMILLLRCYMAASNSSAGSIALVRSC